MKNCICKITAWNLTAWLENILLNFCEPFQTGMFHSSKVCVQRDCQKNSPGQDLDSVTAAIADEYILRNHRKFSALYLNINRWWVATLAAVFWKASHTILWGYWRWWCCQRDEEKTSEPYHTVVAINKDAIHSSRVILQTKFPIILTVTMLPKGRVRNIGSPTYTLHLQRLVKVQHYALWLYSVRNLEKTIRFSLKSRPSELWTIS